MTRLIVERAGKEGPPRVDVVECVSLSFDGGSLIAFHDDRQTSVAGAWGPGGWAHCRWEREDKDEICRQWSGSDPGDAIPRDGQED